VFYRFEPNPLIGHDLLGFWKSRVVQVMIRDYEDFAEN
jgi:hypothetical protein